MVSQPSLLTHNNHPLFNPNMRPDMNSKAAVTR